MLVLAPHPDDEALATGGLLQRSSGIGASIRVVFITDGEDNPWPQRAADRLWRIGPQERARWSARRRSEALRSLRMLGLEPDHASFLGFPDQRLTSLLVAGDAGLGRALRELLDEWSPTHVFYPSAHDHHPDHSALAVVVRTVCGRRRGGTGLFEYVVHDGRQRPVGQAIRLDLGPDEIACKRDAIGCHVSQLIFRKRELLKFAAPLETYYDTGPAGDEEPSHPIRSVTIEAGRLAIRLCREPCLRAFGRATIHLLFPDIHGIRRVMRIALPWRSRLTPVEFADGRVYPHPAEYRGGPYRGTLRVPLAPLPRLLPGYVKIEARFGFFDEAGWRTLPVLKVASSRRALAAAARDTLAGGVPG